jgi:hypothetical protein
MLQMEKFELVAFKVIFVKLYGCIFFKGCIFYQFANSCIEIHFLTIKNLDILSYSDDDLEIIRSCCTIVRNWF